MTDRTQEGDLPTVDVVVVAYRNEETIRACVAPLCTLDGVEVTVVDNEAGHPSLAAVRELPVTPVPSPRNGGFAAGCNLGIAQGHAPFVLLLNPDAILGAADLRRLVEVATRDPSAGIVAPKLLNGDGSLAFSQRRFPRLRSTWAQALFVHRLLPRSSWTDEVIRDRVAYEWPGTPDWVSGACMLLRRDVLERIGGLDERYLLYCEDIDLCAQVRAAGLEVRYEPSAVARHREGSSAPRSGLLALLARNRVLYARKHRGPAAAFIESLGVATGHAVRLPIALARPALVGGHAAAVRAALRPTRELHLGA
jgi:N-acetylglucosaminyl-diphospho-decaprenol L-rhamnosyltransferase